MPDMPAENKNNNGLESEKRLLNDIKNGSRSAMRELYDRYSGYATAVCLRYIPDRDEMQDVMQDSFVKIFAGQFRVSWGRVAEVVDNEDSCERVARLHTPERTVHVH